MEGGGGREEWTVHICHPFIPTKGGRKGEKKKKKRGRVIPFKGIVEKKVNVFDCLLCFGWREK